MKTCNQCKVEKELHLFSRSRTTKSGYLAICADCKNSNQREYRKANGDINTKKYEKTVDGYLMRTYRNMLSRVKGILKEKRHLYEGLEILSKQEFYDWAKGSPEFLVIFKEYGESDYQPGMAPSIDREDSSKGYTLDNMRWLTHSENSRLGAVSTNRSKRLRKPT